MALSLSEVDPFGSENMAESVTRHAQNPLERGFEFLLAGVDTLDLGVYVSWKSHWPQLLSNLQLFKEQARGTKGVLDKTPEGRKFLHLPSGKQPNYRYQLRFAEYRLYIATTNPPGQSPNVYVSIDAKTLWEKGIDGSIALVKGDIEIFGGQIQRIQPSRCDLSTDWYLPGGLTLEFLKKHKVSRSKAHSHYENGDQLETFYIGAPGAKVLLRIYDKGKEVLKSRKLWFVELWGREGPEDVWRVEYQLQRAPLKSFGIKTVEDLKEKLGGIWKYLTEKWASLRLLDNKKPERRTMLPWWHTVQQKARYFGELLDVVRTVSEETSADVDWYISHMGGCLPAYAARIGATNFNDAVNQLISDLCLHWFEKDFPKEVERRALLFGRQFEDKEKEDEEENDLQLFQ